MKDPDPHPESSASSHSTPPSDIALPDLKKKLGYAPEGLSEKEVQERLDKYGPNELQVTHKNPVLKFLSYFWGPIPWMIEAAAILSVIVNHWSDFIIILVLLVANGAVGFWEEYQADNAIAALRSKLALKARVKRGGRWISVEARELVPGDLCRVRLGDIIPADARLLEGDPVEVDQSSLTGESLPVTRKPGETLYSGAVIRQGESNALVFATGRNTYFGHTAQLVESSQSTSHFQKAILRIGDYLILLAAALVIIILAVALFRGDEITTTLQFALVLTVAAIPVAMPTVLSVTMAVGAKLLAAKQAIVSRLASIEELAGIDILCSDKTGTLTKNSLTLGESFRADGVTSDALLLSAALASREEDQDPIDAAILGGIKDSGSLKSFTVERFLPFDPVKKRTEATVSSKEGQSFKVSKGAVQVILELSSNASALESKVEEAVREFASRGFRSLGVARTNEKGEWEFQGILSMYDPPREDSASTISTARDMGVRVKMITGDQLAIGKEIAQQLSMGTNILDAAGFSESRPHEAGLFAEAIENADGFAQVFPEHKHHIIDVLQQRGHIVGMTGDGVNDAPALKKADVGIAVSGATDAARAAASMVLLAPGLSVIIDAIKESRRIFQRMTSYAIYRITETIRVLLFMTLSILVFNFYPVTAVMIVLLALLNDGAILSIAFDRVHYSKTPETWQMREVLGIATILGITGVITSFGLFYVAERMLHLGRDFIQPLMYLKLSVAGHLTIFVARTRGPFWSIRPAPILLFAVLGTQVAATLIAVYGLFMPPIGWTWAAGIWAYALFEFIVNDRVKLAAYRLLGREGIGFLGGHRKNQT